jgi:Phage tail tube protein
MSSANYVRIAAIEESTYGVTPGAGNFDTVRFISEALSGTPDTVESQQIRTDRLASGQVVTGLQVGGEMGFELAKEAALEKFIASAMYSSWDVLALVTVDLSYNSATKELTRASGDWSASSIVVGDFLTLSGFSTAGNNTVVMVTSVDSATVIKIAVPAGMATEVGTGTAYKRADKIEIGTTKKSFTIEKKFLDLTDKGIVYRGMIVSQMDLNVAFGELISGSFQFSGNDYQTVDLAADFATFGRTLNAAATTGTFNGSIDMPFLASSAIGVLDNSNFDIQSIAMSLNNNLNPQNVIGDIAPKDYSAGTAQISMDITAYLTDAGWEILGKKLTQESFALGFMVKNTGGWYGFYIPAIQVSFEDPAAGGANQDVLLNMSGTARVGESGEKSLAIYRPS